MHPDVFVTVRKLRLRARPQYQHVGHVQLVVGAARPQYGIGNAEHQRVEQHLRDKSGRFGAQAGHMACVFPVEVGNDRVDVGSVGVWFLYVWGQLRKDLFDQLGAEALLNDHRPVGVEHLQHVFEGLVILEMGQLSLLHHGLTLFQREIER